jgi:hypothetical protein
MEHFKVDGTTVLSWAIQVHAHNEREAGEEALRIAGWIDLPTSLAMLRRTQHRVAAVGLTDPENE